MKATSPYPGWILDENPTKFWQKGENGFWFRNGASKDDELEQALATLRMFPDDKRDISNLESEDTHSVQPIPNQRINSHYSKKV
jgi:hypothetical protein